ncbi:MAG: CPBP family intramembrane metalloprotease [Peptostreptococcaceae bacterium]|nr:CPBP family intramembrane metalloprotease [Peptostreptococcaceae bacterium]
MVKHKKSILVIYSLIAVGVLYYIEQILIPGYIVKSISKILLFFVGSKLLQRMLGIRRESISLFKASGISLRKLVVLGATAFASVLGAAVVLSPQINLTAISGELENALHVNSGNFIAVGIYITIVNSALEEFFFRGFLFMNLKKDSPRERFFAYTYSSLLFSFYHLSIFRTWFDPRLLAVSLAGLVAAGTFFNYLDEKSDSILYSYIVHACGDAAIILIGLEMFGLL